MAPNPLVSLASSIHAGPKTFALLIGSGVSASSGVPTGWDVTLDLIRRLAVLQGEDAGDNPVAWYREQVGGEPDYSALLIELAPSPVDRRNLLEPYFEPTDDERADGLKLPTNAHNSIAKLVADGFVKVIVTANFDRLLEAALTEAGVQPKVVSSPDHAAGTLPLAHSRCSIIKVHGDYLSPDLKNTVDELERYDPAIDQLLDEVFDQYGLLVCGWSGKWDPALRNAILRSPGRRFATYWLHRDPIEPEAQEIASHRDAICISIQDADGAFGSLADMVDALTGAADQRPQDTAFAVAQLKKYLPDSAHRIKLHDLLLSETNDAIDQFSDLPMEGEFGDPEYAGRMKVYEEATAKPLKLLATGAFFSDSDKHDELWARCVQLLATRKLATAGMGTMLSMQQYPTVLALYAIALGAVASDRLEPIALALGTIRIQDSGQDLPVGVLASSWEVLDRDRVKRSIEELAHTSTPISDHLLGVLHPAMSEIIRDQEHLEDLFDEVEYLLGLSYASHYDHGHGPTGRMSWRSRFGHNFPGSVVDRHSALLVGKGVFRDNGRLSEIREIYDESIRQAYFR
ncbi:MAG: hypothetical protein F4Z06_13010 [Acidimicrobiia bacterium]|nr:hypothetical protein [Acidimicrobiia bacterium]MYE72751.1 hypothetical protein [Acidimicrobiia bacterium]MYJ61880.1 hypothetical protein [Acidimicrobiia bacterium]